MFIHYNNRNTLNKNLHDVLTRFYSADALWSIFQDLIYPAKLLTSKENKPKKATMVEQLENVLESKESIAFLFESIPPQLREVLTELTWNGAQKLNDLEKKLGFELTEKKRRKPKFSYECERTDHTPKPEFHWVVYEEHRGYSYHEQIITVTLPPAIAAALKKGMPKPKGYHPEPLTELPDNLLNYRCDDQLAEDFRVVADYISRGHLQFNKNETIKKPCIRAIAGLTSGGEFFPNEKSSTKLPFLRHELLVNLIAFCGPSLRDAMLEESPDPDKLLRLLCDTLFEHPEWFHEIVLTHIKTKGWENYSQKAATNLRELFSTLPPGEWISGANLENIAHYRDINIDPMPSVRCQVTIDRASASYDYYTRIDVDQTNGVELLNIPLIQGTAFLLAALGWAEIAYTLPPRHAMWQRSSEIFLTPYDGLYALRLTPAGTYALGIENELQLKTSNHARAEIILNPQRLTATCRNIDPITEMSLLEFMEKISNGCYRMTRQTLLRGCSAQNDIEQRVVDFRRHIAKEIPPFWETFFESAIQSAIALKAQPRYTVYELNDNPELRRLFLTDPILREKTLKVEGIRIAIKKADLAAVARRLSALGYLMK